MRIRSAVSLEYFSSVWMGVEVVGSIIVGLMAGSFALLAFGGDSVVELLSATVVLRHLRQDAGGSEHLGVKTARATNLLLFSLIPIIGAGSILTYLLGLRPEGSPFGIAVAVGAFVVMPYLWLKKRRMGEETRCLPLSMDATESATCYFMSIALLGGLLAEFFFGLWWVDYLSTGVILAFVGREAIEGRRTLG